MRCSWFKDHFRQVHMDFHMPEFPRGAIKNFQAKEFVDNLEYGKINLVALFAKCHFGNSYYNTQSGHKHSGLRKDFLMETAAECRKRGIRTLAYYSMTVDKFAFDNNPAWRYRDGEGKEYSGNFGTVCMNTPYKDELALRQIEEIAAGYPVDGLFIDIPFPWGAWDYFCFCDFCRERWKIEYNITNLSVLSTAERMRLNVRLVECWLMQVRDIVNRANPDMVICMNQVGTASVSKRIKEMCNIGVWESQPRPGDYLGHSFSSRTARNEIVDVQVMTVRFYEGWGDMSLKPEPQLRTECAAIIGNGMVPCVGDQVDIDGMLQRPVYDTFAQTYGFVEKYEPVLKNAEPVRHTMVLLPAADPDLPLIASAAKDDPDLYWKDVPASWRGAHKLLVESHIQNDFTYSVYPDDLSQFPEIILPEPSGYQEGMDGRLKEYVKNGGILIAAGKSIVSNGRCSLNDLFGIEYVEPFSFTMTHFKPEPAVAGDLADIPLQVRGKLFKVIPVKAKTLARIYYPAGQTQPPVKGFRHDCPPALKEASPYPFATVNKFGKGKAVYIAASLFEIYWKTNHHWLRQFTESLIRYIDSAQPVNIDASGRIEVNLMKTKNGLLLNLINYSLGHQGGQNAIAGIERIDKVYNIPCSVRCSGVRKVLIEPEKKEIPFVCKNGTCTFTVPKLEYLSVVHLEGAK